ncbi:MAG: Ig-like domain-containing protein, partial [Prevotella sp.]|nr:Ig-like domain-containing protein [Prevotella sp.]
VLIKIVYSESSVTISNSSVSGITVGNTFNLNASVVPTGSTLTYTSSNPSVASVDSNGIVSGIASGSTTITITASEYVDDENLIVYRSGSTTVNLSVEEASQPFNSVEILSTAYIDSSYDDNLHVTMKASNANGSYYMFIIEASGNFTYTYNKKPDTTGSEALQFESLMSEDFYTENPYGYDTAINQYWSETYNGNYNDPEAAQITVTGLPEGKYTLRFYAPTYRIKVGNIYGNTKRTMHGFFTIS